MIHKWNFIKIRRWNSGQGKKQRLPEGEKNKQERKLITEIVCINCHALLPSLASYFVSFSPSKSHLISIVVSLTNKKSHHPLTYCNSCSPNFLLMEITFLWQSRGRFSCQICGMIWGRSTMISSLSLTAICFAFESSQSAVGSINYIQMFLFLPPSHTV
jgi:hypothetical protein